METTNVILAVIGLVLAYVFLRTKPIKRKREVEAPLREAVREAEKERDRAIGRTVEDSLNDLIDRGKL